MNERTQHKGHILKYFISRYKILRFKKIKQSLKKSISERGKRFELNILFEILLKGFYKSSRFKHIVEFWKENIHSMCKFTLESLPHK